MLDEALLRSLVMRSMRQMAFRNTSVVGLGVGAVQTRASSSILPAGTASFSRWLFSRQASLTCLLALLRSTAWCSIFFGEETTSCTLAAVLPSCWGLSFNSHTALSGKADAERRCLETKSSSSSLSLVSRSCLGNL